MLFSINTTSHVPELPALKDTIGGTYHARILADLRRRMRWSVAR